MRRTAKARNGLRRNPWVEYERLKREIPPGLTPQQYAAACRALAKESGA